MYSLHMHIMFNSVRTDFHIPFEQNSRVHALSYIMGNQGKIAKKQSGKRYVFLHISVELNFRDATLTINIETPFLHSLMF